MKRSSQHIHITDMLSGISRLRLYGGLLITLILGFGYTKIDAQGCEIPGYTFGGNYEGHSYYISNELAIWTEAKALAESIGGHLATIPDANENAFVVEIVDDAYFWDYAWIGLTDEDVEGVYVWVTGEPLIYTNWGSPGGAEDDYTAVYSSYYGANWSSYESPPAIGVYIVEFDSLIVEFESLICNCDDPLYAGYDNSITICNDSSPFDLTEMLGGNPDPGGTWSPALASGGDIYDPVIDGPGVFTYTVSAPDCPSDSASITINVIDAEIPIISGVPPSICESDNPVPLPTIQDGTTGNWSGPGIINNVFYPAGLNGIITILFTPDPGQCASEVPTNIDVDPLIVLTISGVPDSLCQFNSPIALPNIQTGVEGYWAGQGVSNNTFNPSGLNGNIILTFIPDSGICASTATASIAVFQNTYSISGVPVSVCVTDLPVILSTFQEGITGNWSGSGVINNTFNPSGLNGVVTLTFTPDADQCALPASENIFVDALILPVITGIPSSLCEDSPPVTLPSVQNGITGNWSGQGVSSNMFDPDNQSGIIILTFTPDAGQCAGDVTTDILVEALLPIAIIGIPDSLCEFSSPISLPFFQSGISGTWSGPGITNDTFHPAGLDGNIILTFEPADGNCALPETASITVFENTYNISGIPASVCSNNTPLPLSTLQDGIMGNWSGPGVSNNTFNPDNQNGNITLTFAPENGQCALPESMVISVSAAIIPAIAGVPASLCESDSILLLPEIQSGITGIWSGSNVSDNSFSPSGLNGNYTLTFSPASGECADTTSIQIAVLTAPSFINLIAACDTAAESYTVSFEITGGDSASYMIDGMSVNGSIFISSPISADSTHYSFTLDDANGCAPMDIEGSIDCACATYAGSLNFGGSPLMVCSGADFDVSFNEDSNLDPDDLIGFVLHDNAGTQLGTIYAISNDTTFSFPPGIILGEVYYVAVIAGSNDGTGNIDLNDPCLSVSQGIPVIFYQLQATLSGGGEICPSACMTYTFNLVGEKPFELMYQVNANGIVSDHVLLTDTSTVSILICPMDYGLTSGTVDIIPISLADANCTFPLPSFPGFQTIVLPATESYISNLLCPGQSLIVNGVIYDQSNPSGTQVMQNAAGCDSTVHIDLSYYPAAVFDLNQTLCFGGSLTINGTEYNETHPQGMETLPGGAINGCDSVINIQLSFDSLVTAYFSTTLCPGESLIINGHLYDELNPTGTEFFPGGSVLGCDSILHIEILLYPEATSNLNPVLCLDEMIIVNGVVYDKSHPSGTEVLEKASYFGCDSSIQINLAFYPEAIGTITDTLFAGDSIIIQGTVYNQSNPVGTEIIPDGSITGCDSMIMTNLFFIEALSVKIETVAPVCHGESSGEIVVEEIIGGLAPYSFIIDGGNPIITNNFPIILSGLQSGNHQFIITDAMFAELVLELVVPEGPILVVDAGVDLVISYGKNAGFTATASFLVSTWTWTPDDFLSCTSCPDPQIVNPDHNVTYTVTAADQNGCIASDNVAIKMVYENEIYAPTVFSPNRDGVNDTWKIYSSDPKTALVSLIIADRWGGIIYSFADTLLNDPGVEWDGTMNGSEMSAGVYVFVAIVETSDGASKQIHGDITLIR